MSLTGAQFRAQRLFRVHNLPRGKTVKLYDTICITHAPDHFTCLAAVSSFFFFPAFRNSDFRLTNHLPPNLESKPPSPTGLLREEDRGGRGHAGGFGVSQAHHRAVVRLQIQRAAWLGCNEGIRHDEIYG